MIYPLKDKKYITQKFGENSEIYKRFGLRGHNGIDFRTKYPDTPKGRRYVYAAKDGKVMEVVNQGRKGYGIFIRLVHEGNEQTVYAHLRRSYIVNGQRVKEGKRIGLTDNTGFSTGAHLHFGYRPNNFKYDNGYAGYIDPLPLLEKPTTPAKELAKIVKQLRKENGEQKQKINKLTKKLQSKNEIIKKLKGRIRAKRTWADKILNWIKKKEKEV